MGHPHARYLLSLALPFLTTFALAQNHGTLLVANQTDHTLSLIDPVAAHQVAAIPEARTTGHEVATIGPLAYVPIYGNSGVGKPGTDGHEMLVIDLPSQKIVNTLDFGHGVRPHCAVYDHPRGVLYVTTELDQTISAIDPKSLKVLYTIPTGQEQSHMFALAHNGKLGYTANVGPGTISVLDMDTHKTVTILPIAPHVQRISISKDDSMVFTSDVTKPQLAVIDTSTNKLKTWIPLPAPGYGTAPTPDGRYLLVAIPSAGKLAVIDLTTLQIARTIDVPSAPQEVLVRPDGLVAYVSCNISHKVAAIDLTHWNVQSLIDAGQGADGLAWAAPTH